MLLQAPLRMYSRLVTASSGRSHIARRSVTAPAAPTLVGLERCACKVWQRAVECSIEMSHAHLRCSLHVLTKRNMGGLMAQPLQLSPCARAATGVIICSRIYNKAMQSGRLQKHGE